VKRPDSGKNTEPKIEEDKGEPLVKWGESLCPSHGKEIKSMESGLDKKVDNGRQDKGTPCEKVKEELHRAILFSCMAPNGDERVHGKKGNIVPDKEEEEVHAHKETENACHQDEVEGKELLYSMFQFPHGENACEVNNACQEDERKIQAISAIEVMDPERWHPDNPFYELKSSLDFVISKKGICGESKANAGENRAHPFDELLAVRWNEKEDQKTSYTT
jgi:hypothetical protein